ncbi:MAG TPA: hypothetical protein VFI65_11615 [Streptosporangiaceae bacterium]|nr:hypothetical protein [Streptosporangiaceae bacterium]
MNDELIELLEAVRPPQFRPGSPVHPAIRQRELTAAFSAAPARASGQHRRHRRDHPGRRSLAILAAALSVALIATGVWLARSQSPGLRTSKPQASKHPTPRPAPRPVKNLLSAPVAKPPSVARAQAGLPPYYIVADHNGPAIEVHSTTTGELLSEVALPAGVDPKLSRIAAGVGGRFVLALFALPRTSFYLLKVTDNGRSAQLSALPAPPVNDSRTVMALALSPDGAKLAVGFQIPNQQGTVVHGAIEVVTLATGATRTWTSTKSGMPVQLSWTDLGRNLGFYWTDDQQYSQSAAGLWKLDPQAPGGNLFSGRRVLPVLVGNDIVQSAAFSPDGKTIDASVYHLIFHKLRRGDILGGVVKLSARTGRPLSTLLVQRAAHSSKFGNQSPSDGGCPLIAADAAANHLLVNCVSQFGRLDRARFTVLPNPDPGVFLTATW